MKKAIRVIWIIVIMMLAALLCSCGGEKTDPAGVLSVEVRTDAGPETIGLWMADEDHAFVFLPSYAERETAFFRLDTDKKITLDGTELSDGMDCGGFLPGQEYELKIGGGKPQKITFMNSSNIAAMYISIEESALEAVHADKKHKENAVITLYNADGSIDYRGGESDRIRGRGQWSWEQDKKPYNLYLDKPADLLGLGEAKRWTLLANAIDETNLRNWLVYSFADRVGQYEGFSQDCEFVDLYLNGQYNGLYLLCEKVEIAENRLNTGEDDFVFSLDAADRIDTMESAFVLNPGVAVEIDNPDPCTQAQQAELHKHLLEMQSVLLQDGDAWREYIDMDSWARKYLIEEIFLNFDAGAQSQYFFLSREDGLVYAGPCWDYDNILGVNGYGMTPECFLAQRTWKTREQYTPWYGALWAKEDYSDYVKELYRREFLPVLREYQDGMIAGTADRIKDAAQADRQRWPDLSKNLDSYEDAVAFLQDFLARRIDFLNSAWISGDPYCTITLKTLGGQYRFFCVRPGTVCENLPTPEDFMVEGETQWYYEDTKEPFDYDTVITEDIDLISGPVLAYWDLPFGEK